jgi:GTP-binding protein EngB required for normal cell division
MGACMKTPVRTIVVIGLSDAGKTTLINRLDGKPELAVSRSIVGSLCLYKTHCGLIEVRERPGFGWGRPGLTKWLLSDARLSGIICVVDASRNADYFLDAPDQPRNVHNDPETGRSHWDAGNVLAELHDVLNAPNTRGLPLLVLANKYDNEGHTNDASMVPLHEVAKRLTLESITDRRWSIEPFSGKTGSNMKALTDWLEIISHSKQRCSLLSCC